MYRFFVTMVFILYNSFTSSAQLINYDFSIHYEPKVSGFWTRCNSLSSRYILDSNIGNLNAGYIELEQANLIDFFNSDYYFMASNYHELKDYKNAVKYYYKAVSKGYLPYSKSTQPEFMVYNDSIVEYKAVLKQLDSLKLHPNCAMDIPFSNLVIALFETDQMTRLDQFFKDDTIMKRSILFDRIKYYVYYDRKILKRLLVHIDQYGIPHQNLMTKEAYDAFKLIVHHQIQYIDSTDNKRLFGLVRSAIEDGRLQKWFLKPAIDYMHWRNNGQYFGTVAQKNKDGKYEMNPPIIDPKNVDKRREEWLFAPLEEQMRDHYGEDFVLPKGYLPRKKINK